MDTAPEYPTRHLRCQVCDYAYHEDNYPVGICPHCGSDDLIEEDKEG